MNWFTLPARLGALFAAALSGCGYKMGERGGSMSIWEAVEQENLDAIEAYVRSGGDLDLGATRLGKTPLLHALILKKKQGYSKLLSLGSNPNTICRGGGAMSGSSVVHHAALEEDPFWLRAALESGGDANQMNGAKGTSKGRPLYFAIVGKGGIENVKLLCEHGADVDAPIDNVGQTALREACEYSKFEVVHYLLERRADVAERRPLGELNTFIYFLRRNRNPDYYRDKKLEHYYITSPELKWCNAVWDWLKSHGQDPEKAKWNGSKWTWEKE